MLPTCAGRCRRLGPDHRWYGAELVAVSRLFPGARPGDVVGRFDRLTAADVPATAVAPLLLRRGRIQARAGLSMPAAESFERAFIAADDEGDHATLVDAALGLEGVTWRPGLQGGHALQRLERATDGRSFTTKLGQTPAYRWGRCPSFAERRRVGAATECRRGRARGDAGVSRAPRVRRRPGPVHPLQPTMAGSRTRVVSQLSRMIDDRNAPTTR